MMDDSLFINEYFAYDISSAGKEYHYDQSNDKFNDESSECSSLGSQRVTSTQLITNTNSNGCTIA